MRTTRDENRAFGEWIGARLNAMNGPVRFLLPEGGVSLLDAPGQPFHDPEADNALFEAIGKTVRQTTQRRVERVRANINDTPFVDAVVEAGDDNHLCRGQAEGRRGVGAGELLVALEQAGHVGHVAHVGSVSFHWLRISERARGTHVSSMPLITRAATSHRARLALPSHRRLSAPRRRCPPEQTDTRVAQSPTSGRDDGRR